MCGPCSTSTATLDLLHLPARITFSPWASISSTIALQRWREGVSGRGIRAERGRRGDGEKQKGREKEREREGEKGSEGERGRHRGRGGDVEGGEVDRGREWEDEGETEHKGKTGCVICSLQSQAKTM